MDPKSNSKKILRQIKEKDMILNSIPDNISLHDLDFHIIWANKAAAKLAGLSQKEMVGRVCYNIWYNRDSPCKQCPVVRTLKTGKLESETIKTIDGRIWDVRVYPISEKGIVECVIVYRRDITEIINETKRTEEMDELLRRKDEFMNIVAHELKTPLVPIKGYLSLLEDEIGDKLKNEQKNILKVISRNVRRLERLIDDVLDISKLEAGTMRFDMEKLDINEVIEDAIQDMGSFAYKKGLTLRAEFNKKLPKINGDRLRLIQVLTNLIENAIKFTNKGEIVISAERDKKNENNIIVKVRDTGIGIKKNDMEKLFKKFSQIDTSIGKKYRGTGLGLAICKKIVEEHGGRIWCESKLNEGSTFYFTLPII